MRRSLTSLRHALHGFEHAFRRERNLRLFLGGYGLVLVVGLFVGITLAAWMMLVLCGGFFVATELINTALERLVDAFDAHRHKTDPDAERMHEGLKCTKDIASAASLIALVTNALVILTVFLTAIEW